MDHFFSILEFVKKADNDLYILEFDPYVIPFLLPSIDKVTKYRVLLSLCNSKYEEYNLYESLFRVVVQDEFLANTEGNLPAGLPKTISNVIFSLSGLTDDYINYAEGLLCGFREARVGILPFMKRTICTTFPGYTYELLEKLNFQKLLFLFSEAEEILLSSGKITEPYSFKPKEIKKQIIRTGPPKEKRREPLEKEKKAFELLRKKAIEKAIEEEREFHRREL